MTALNKASVLNLESYDKTMSRNERDTYVLINLSRMFVFRIKIFV